MSWADIWTGQEMRCDAKGCDVAWLPNQRVRVWLEQIGVGTVQAYALVYCERHGTERSRFVELPIKERLKSKRTRVRYDADTEGLDDISGGARRC